MYAVDSDGLTQCSQAFVSLNAPASTADPPIPRQTHAISTAGSQGPRLFAALVPPPWQNQVRYSGVLAPASTWRPRIVPKPKAEPHFAEPRACDHDALACELDRNTQRTVPKGKGCRYWPWRLLKSRTFGEPTTQCSHCEGELTLRAVVQDRDSIHRILSHLRLPTDIPKPAPSRGPPYYRGRVRRMRPSGPQQDLPH